MNQLFPLPLFTFLKTAYANGGFSGKGLLNSTPWWIKTTLLEPLRWIELATQDEKIKAHSIKQQPVFILGYYRSGTTYLQQLFRKDDRFGNPSLFQAIFPEIMLCSEKWLTPALEWITRLLKIQNPVHRIPLTWDSTGEDDVAMTASLYSGGAQWGQFFPGKMGEYFQKYVLFENISPDEMETWDLSYQLLLKKISLANYEKQLVLKSPPNTARIKRLLSFFPDAKFIFIHRNPYEVFASNQKLWKVVEKHYALGSTQAVNYNDLILETYAGIMNRYLHDKHLIPPGHLAEIGFEEFISEPVCTMKQLYASLSLGDFDYCEKKMAAFACSQEKYLMLHHELAYEEIKTISKKWEPFIRHWNYQLL